MTLATRQEAPVLRPRTVPLVVVAAMVLTGCAREVDPGEGPSPPGEVVEPTAIHSPTGSPSPAPSPSPTEPSGPSLDEVELALEEVVTGLEAATLLTSPPDDRRRFVLEQVGRIRLLEGGELATYLDLTDRVTVGGERGLLGLAFHPDFGENGRLFVHYSGEDGRTVLAEYAADPAAPEADRSSERVLLTHDQPAANHNGGTVAFGPDGMLYLGLGDGGGAGDQFGHGQDAGTLLGTILRIDVDGERPYEVPDDNPFVDGEGAPEVWVYGLRNPWRFTFARDHLLIGDVGQDAVEELDAVPVGDAAGRNFGWPILEGSRCFREPDCDRQGTTLPVEEYTHEETGGCAVISGEVYEGEAVPALRGHWFYSDLCAGFLRSIRVEDGEVVERRDWTDQVGPLEGVYSFGRDGDGEVYITLQDGRVLRIVAGP